MRFCLGLLVAVATVFSTAGRSNADLFLSVDLDSAAAGVQSTNSVPLNIGDQITATFFLQQTGNDGLSVFNFDVQWGSALKFVSRSESIWTSNWKADDDIQNTGGAGFNFAGRFDGIANAPAGQTTPVAASPVGTLTLEVVGFGPSFINAGFFDQDFNFALNANSDILNDSVILQGGNANVAVPEPTSMAALAVAGVGGLIVRRRASRKKAAAE